MRPLCIILATFIALIGAGKHAFAESTYMFPFTNPYEATVIEAPPEFQADISQKISQRIINLKVFPKRKIPKVFWYENGLPCSLTYQDHKAPLIFIIAGTGARYDSPKMIDLQHVFYKAGFHVVSISSPTHMDFVINASSSMVPGDLAEDAEDLYRVMRLAMKQIATQIAVTNYYLTGYSLGGIQSAFVSKLDEEQQQFKFRKVLLINPPVSLYRSVSILDRLLDDNIPGGLNNFKPWLDEVMQNLSDIYKEMGYFEFSGEYIYKVHERYPRREPFLRAIIGLSFRMSSSNMIFAADIMNGGGYITPTNAEMDYATSLTPYAMVACRTTFSDYFHQYLFPYARQYNPDLTEEQLISRLSLNFIEPYLGKADKIGILHNQDDIILDPGDIDYIRQLFGPRAQIYPSGGHCGNMNHPDVVRFMTHFFSVEGD